MTEKFYKTPFGDIHYFVNIIDPEEITLVFLPGLTADHRLFEKQIPHYEGRMNVFVWDAPGHLNSRPFALEFQLADKATWLKEILDIEGITKPLLIGQSMGGYVSQAFLELYPQIPVGFISIDSGPLALKYSSKFDLFFMKHSEGMYRMFPWKTLLKAGSEGVATTPYGQDNMRIMMESYNDAPLYYCKLVGHGYRMLAQAIKMDLEYKITCPALILCGDKDMAGVTKEYNKRWIATTGLPFKWIADAGHNSNADKPDEVNGLIDNFISKLP